MLASLIHCTSTFGLPSNPQLSLKLIPKTLTFLLISMSGAWSNQPFRALYTLLFALKLSVLIPLALLRYSFRPARPVAEWSLWVCVTTQITTAPEKLKDRWSRDRVA
ncbi:hypothetical protein GGR52DRAFT_536153 [Hypoxylon sp. FL1284]|nr:hypothetical protein GGR52DRAFT_536153 [Hypoxylon sp. FL1284]